MPTCDKCHKEFYDPHPGGVLLFEGECMDCLSPEKRERLRIILRRAELGDAEIARRQAIADKAQEICAALTYHPKAAEVQPMLKMAEELRERLNTWLWG